MTKKKPYYMTVRHCRMRLNGIEEIMSELIEKINEMHHYLKHAERDDDK